jgi:RimJ/RimL family protein N-acetyltransferase
MADLFEHSRRRFIQLSQVAVGSGIGILFSPKFWNNSSSSVAAKSLIYYVFCSFVMHELLGNRETGKQ